MSSDGAKRNAASAVTNVTTDDDLLKLILDNAGLLACRHARVSKQWKRAAEAVKLSGQTLDLDADDDFVDLGHPMHSLVGFKIRA